MCCFHSALASLTPLRTCFILALPLPRSCCRTGLSLCFIPHLLSLQRPLEYSHLTYTLCVPSFVDTPLICSPKQHNLRYPSSWRSCGRRCYREVSEIRGRDADCHDPHTSRSRPHTPRGGVTSTTAKRNCSTCKGVRRLELNTTVVTDAGSPSGRLHAVRQNVQVQGRFDYDPATSTSSMTVA